MPTLLDVGYAGDDDHQQRDLLTLFQNSLVVSSGEAGVGLPGVEDNGEWKELRM